MNELWLPVSGNHSSSHTNTPHHPYKTPHPHLSPFLLLLFKSYWSGYHSGHTSQLFEGLQVSRAFLLLLCWVLLRNNFHWIIKTCTSQVGEEGGFICHWSKSFQVGEEGDAWRPLLAPFSDDGRIWGACEWKWKYEDMRIKIWEYEEPVSENEKMRIKIWKYEEPVSENEKMRIKLWEYEVPVSEN